MANKVLNVTTIYPKVPTSKEEIANKEYVDNAVGKRMKEPVRVVLAENLDSSYDSVALTLTQTVAAEVIIDGVTLQLNDRVLLAGQTDNTQNGIYTLTTLGVTSGDQAVLTRSEDFDESQKIQPNVSIPVMEGTENSDVTWQLVNNTQPTLDTDSLVFSKLKGSQGINKYVGVFTGDGVEKEYTITHGLGTKDIIVKTTHATTGEEWVFGIDKASQTDNTIKLVGNAVLELTDTFNVVVMG
jgi:hypothetical protein